MHIYEKEFDFVIHRAKSLERRARAVVAGADCENILKAVFEAEAQGFIRPILVGDEDKITKMLKKLIPYYTLNPDFRDEREEEYDEIFEGEGYGRVRDMEEAQVQGRV